MGVSQWNKTGISSGLVVFQWHMEWELVSGITLVFQVTNSSGIGGIPVEQATHSGIPVVFHDINSSVTDIPVVPAENTRKPLAFLETLILVSQVLQ